MPNIPLSDIPNAPSTGAPTLAPTLPHVPGLPALDVSGARADTGGLERTRSLLGEASAQHRQGNAVLARAIEGGKQGRISAAPFVEAAGAWDTVGRAFQTSDAVLSKFADNMARARDTVAMAEASTVMNDAFTQHSAAIESGGMPEPSQWVPTWQKDVMPKAAEKLATIQASPMAKAQIQASWMRFSSETTQQFALSATRKATQIAGGKVLNAAEEAFQNGHYEEAQGLIENAVKTGVIRSDVGEEKINSLMREKRNEDYTALVTQNPKAAIDDLEAAGPEGDSHLFADTKPSERVRWLDAAKQQLHVNQSDAMTSALDSIVSGEFTTPEDVQKYGEQNDLDPQDIASLQKNLTLAVQSTPAGQARYEAGISEIQKQVYTYNPTTDKDLTQFRAIIRNIATSATGEDRELYLNELKKIRSEGIKVDPDLQKTLIDEADSLQKQGLINFEGFKLDKNGTPQPVKGKETEALASNVAQMDLRDKIRTMLKQNPGISSEEARQKFVEMVGPQAAKQGASLFMPKSQESGGGWWTWAVAPFPKTMMWIGDQIRPKEPQPNDTMIQKPGESLKDMQNRNSQSSVSPDLLNFVKDQEGYAPKAFSDYKQISIGYGTRAKSRDEEISKADAEKRLAEELAVHAKNVDLAAAKKGFSLTPGQRNALISFDFNTGEGDHLISTSSNVAEIARRLPTWNKVTENGRKVESQGLVNRRSAEMELFNS